MSLFGWVKWFSKEARALREAEATRDRVHAQRHRIMARMQMLKDPVPALTPLPFTLKTVNPPGETTQALDLALTRVEQSTDETLGTLRSQVEVMKAEAQETRDIYRGKR